MTRSDHPIESAHSIAGSLLPACGSSESLVRDADMAIVVAAKRATTPRREKIERAHVPTGDVTVRKSVTRSMAPGDDRLCGRQTRRPRPPHLSVPARTGLAISTGIDLPQHQTVSTASMAVMPASTSDFLAMLQAVVEKSPGMRPFMCDGNPLTCAVAIVGVDPGTTTPFWRHWSDAMGMDRASWLHADRTMRKGPSDPSRSVLEHLLARLANRVVELNAIARHGKVAPDPGQDHQTTDVLQYMLEAVRPSIVVCIGATALRVVQGMSQPWTPRIIQTREIIDWDIAYQRVLAGQVNAASFPRADLRRSDGTARICATAI